MERENFERHNLITSFLKEGKRNRLIILQALDNLCIQPVNIGLELAQALKGKEGSRRLPSIADEALKGILDQHTHSSPSFGNYIGLVNLGILFEPDLRIEVAELLKRHSQNTALFVEWPGEREEGILYFLSKAKGKSLSLKGVSHLSI